VRIRIKTIFLKNDMRPSLLAIIGAMGLVQCCMLTAEAQPVRRPQIESPEARHYLTETLQLFFQVKP
jgi:hypothetical protein